jgi:hypothetical protein
VKSSTSVKATRMPPVAVRSLVSTTLAAMTLSQAAIARRNAAAWPAFSTP